MRPPSITHPVWRAAIKTSVVLLAVFLAPQPLACRSRSGADQGAVGTSVLHGSASPRAADTTFARLIARLSEPAGFFDTDNLISNETSYLHVLDKIRALGVSGGAYIGVGPDQNFSYIAHIQPRIAFIVDIRRDNLLQHLFFKALFARSPTRLEYLAQLVGASIPARPAEWTSRSLEEIVAYVDGHRTPTAVRDSGVTQAIRATLLTFGVPLSEQDLATIARIHESFRGQGLDLRFTSLGRPPRPYYPTLRQLLLERDLSGQLANYLVDRDRFRVVKSLQERDLIIPVVGNLAGDHTLAAIADFLQKRGDTVSAFYTSNVEFYLVREGSFDRFAANVARLPLAKPSVIIRSYFGGIYRTAHPQSVPGYFSTQLLQTTQSLVREHAEDGYDSYWSIVTKHTLDLRP